jgi:hypothetical protein
MENKLKKVFNLYKKEVKKETKQMEKIERTTFADLDNLTAQMLNKNSTIVYRA